MMDTKTLLHIVETGGVIAYPTDTIWGIGCDATNADAVDRVFSLKKRPKEKSLIVLMNGEEMLREYGVILTPEQQIFLQEAIKPVTMILSGVTGLASNVYHTDGTVGVRIVKPSTTNPGSQRCYDFIELCGRPLVSTSANVSGAVTPRIFEEITSEIITSLDGFAGPTISQNPGEPSQIVRIDTNGEVAMLRP